VSELEVEVSDDDERELGDEDALGDGEQVAGDREEGEEANEEGLHMFGL